MNVGKTLFAQVMEFVPWKTFGRIIERHNGDAGVRTLGCADLFRVMAFSQLTWRESLRDIEVCLEANQAKLFHMGIATPPARSTLADALNLRDSRIYHALALRLIAHARVLYAQDPSVLDLDASVYALDSTTIDLCLSLFDWAPFRSNKAAIKLHTLLDLRGAIPAFIHISDGKLHDVNVLDILLVEAGRRRWLWPPSREKRHFRSWPSSLTCIPTRLRSGRASFWRAQSGFLEARRSQRPRRLRWTLRPSTPRSAS